MNLFDNRLRARVVDVQGRDATLAIYVDGFWHRIKAKTEIELHQGAWIEGRLTITDQQVVTFKLAKTPAAEAEPEPSHSQSGLGLDLEV